MNCPYCNNSKTKVVDKRDNNSDSSTRRRRECLKCEKRFTTQERIETIDLTVIKKNGSPQAYDREKLIKSIFKALDKDIYNEEDVNKIADGIEMRLLNRKSSMVTSTDIGRMVLTRLKKLDPVSYMRFASIYKGFKSLQEFKDEFEQLTEA